MRFKKRRSWRPLYFITGGSILVLIVWLFVDNNRPFITAVFPDADTFPAPAMAPIRITFDRPMNTGATTEALQTEPARSGEVSWEENEMLFTPARPWPPGAAVTVTLTTEARTATGIRLDDAFSWTFRTAPTLLAYLWPEDLTGTTPAQLYIMDLTTGEVAQFTDTAYGVNDFDISPDGLSILLSVANEFGGADLASLDMLSREITQVLACQNALCSQPQYDPSGNIIAYENTTTHQILIMESGSDPKALGPGRFPTWSSTGLLLAYDQNEEAYFSYAPATKTKLFFSNIAGEPANWSSDGGYFLAPAIKLIGSDAFASHIVRYSRTGLQNEDLTRMEWADDNVPIESPDGTRIAFARRFLSPSRWTPGRQLWVMSSNGENAVQLTTDGLYNHTALAWHPDNTQIAYVRSNQADLNEPPEIWLISLDGSPAVRLIINGFSPKWLP